MRSIEVDDYLGALGHELLPLVGALRAAILSVSPEIVESMKWKAPNYALADDFATFNLRRPGVVQVILHTGAKPKPRHPTIVVDDPAGLLRWPDRNRAIATFTGSTDVATAVPGFAVVTRRWVDQLR